MWIDQVSYLIKLLLCDLLNLVFPQAVLDTTDRSLDPTIGLAVVATGVHMVDADLPQHGGELGSECPATI